MWVPLQKLTIYLQYSKYSKIFKVPIQVNGAVSVGKVRMGAPPQKFSQGHLAIFIPGHFTATYIYHSYQLISLTICYIHSRTFTPIFVPISSQQYQYSQATLIDKESIEFKLTAFQYFPINRSGSEKKSENILYFRVILQYLLLLKSLLCRQFLVGQTLGNDYARGQNYTRLAPFFLFTDDKFLRNFHLLRITRKLEEVSPSHQNFQLDWKKSNTRIPILPFLTQFAQKDLGVHCQNGCNGKMPVCHNQLLIC